MNNLKNKLKETSKKVGSCILEKATAIGIGLIIGINIANFQITKKQLEKYDNDLGSKEFVAQRVIERYFEKGALFKTFNIGSYIQASREYLEVTKKLYK